MEQESSWSRVSSLISDWYHQGRVVTMREFEERIEALTVDEILDYWRGHPPGRYRIVTLGKKKLKVRSTG
jgi:hypothetical protein